MFRLFCKGHTDKWYLGICWDFPTGLPCQILDVFYQLRILSFFFLWEKSFLYWPENSHPIFFLLIKNAELIIGYSLIWVTVGPWTMQRLGALTSHTVESPNITYTDSQPWSWLLDCVGCLNGYQLKKKNTWISGSTHFELPVFKGQLYLHFLPFILYHCFGLGFE